MFPLQPRAMDISSRPLLKFIPVSTLHRLIVVQCGLAIVLLLLGGSFRQFFSLAIFAEWLFYMIAGSTVFVFRRRDPNADRPYRVWGYPVVPAVFVLVSAATPLLHLHRQPEKSALGCLAILAGVPSSTSLPLAARRHTPK